MTARLQADEQKSSASNAQNLTIGGLGLAIMLLFGLVLADRLAPQPHDLADQNAVEPIARHFATHLPYPLPKNANARKQLFLKELPPLVLRVNEALRADRARLRQVRGKVLNGRPLTPVETAWLRQMADHYDTELRDFDTLLHRVDAIPPSIVLAQAATESGWGSSRFAQQGNALFGQRVWRAGGGIVPTDRSADAKYEVQSFPSLEASIRAYAHNLNRHPAYGDFRDYRANHKPHPDPLALVATLSAYSEIGGDYVEILRQVIEENHLAAFDNARFGAQTAH